MRVLIVRLSAMGDLVQTLPAITDAKLAMPDLVFDWVVDESFADVPRMHPGVERVITSAFRRYGRGWRRAFASGEVQAFLKELRAEKYDLVIDVQGNFKSALAGLLARGSRAGYVGSDAHEWGAHLTYAHKHRVPKGQHSMARMRRLLSHALGYTYDPDVVDYGIDRSRLPHGDLGIEHPYIVIVHSTSWPSKNWPFDHIRQLVEFARASDYTVVLPWGSDTERTRSESLAADDPGVVVLPKLSIAEKATVISGAAGTVGLDTGLSHISAALGVPSVTLYGPTDPALVGAIGERQRHLVPDFRCLFCHKEVCRLDGTERDLPQCLDRLTAREVWNELTILLSSPAF